MNEFQNLIYQLRLGLPQNVSVGMLPFGLLLPSWPSPTTVKRLQESTHHIEYELEGPNIEFYIDALTDALAERFPSVEFWYMFLGGGGGPSGWGRKRGKSHYHYSYLGPIMNYFYEDGGFWAYRPYCDLPRVDEFF